VFGAAADRLVFAERTLAVPFVTSSAGAFAQIVPRLEAELVARRRTRTLVDDARLAIARTISAGMRPSVDEVARRMRISPRTLQRRLGEADTTCQSQLDDVRRVSARRLLSQTELEPTDIAFLLGFAEPNSFARAFRTWERTSPLRWRAARS
jgi:AraC-like DNA-binding protein